MPDQPVEVLKTQPQASLSGVHDGEHIVDFAVDLVFGKIASLLENAGQCLPVVDGLASGIGFWTIFFDMPIVGAFSGLVGDPHWCLVVIWPIAPFIGLTILGQLACS